MCHSQVGARGPSVDPSVLLSPSAPTFEAGLPVRAPRLPADASPSAKPARPLVASDSYGPAVAPIPLHPQSHALKGRALEAERRACDAVRTVGDRAQGLEI